jgi:hypothetical protein
MNLKTAQRKFAVPVIAGAALLLAAAFSAAAQPTNGTDFASFQVISQRNIFDPNRVAHTRFNSAHASARIVDSFSFLGTMSYEKGDFAFFDGTSPDFHRVLKLDGDIAGFKVTTLTPKSVTLLSGTNEMILPVGTQVRRDDDGHWVISTGPASYTNAGNSHVTGSGRHHRHQDSSAGSNSPATSTTNADNSQADDLNTTDSGPDTNAPEVSAPSGGGANDALTRLMQQRAQEEQQLGAGQ